MRELFYENLSQYSTHRRALYTALEATSGKVLEIGMGDNSTPQLHVYCELNNRYLLSVEDNLKWFDMFKSLASSLHDIKLINYDDLSSLIKSTKFSVVFVDHSPKEGGSGRGKLINEIAHDCEIIVTHDIEPDFEDHYNWKGQEVEKKFKYSLYDTVIKPHSALFSNFIDLSRLHI